MKYTPWLKGHIERVKSEYSIFYNYILLITTLLLQLQLKLAEGGGVANSPIIHSRLAHSRVFHNRVVPKMQKIARKIIEPRRKRQNCCHHWPKLGKHPSTTSFYDLGKCFFLQRNWHTYTQTDWRTWQLYDWIGLVSHQTFKRFIFLHSQNVSFCRTNCAKTSESKPQMVKNMREKKLWNLVRNIIFRFHWKNLKILRKVRHISMCLWHLETLRPIQWKYLDFILLRVTFCLYTRANTESNLCLVWLAWIKKA